MDAPAAAAATRAPFVSADRSLPELTVKAIILGVLLAIVLGAANMYVGLRVGLTVSASIPAAVLSMGILRLFKNSNILENNIVQTFAASGQAVAAGVIFTIPALLLIDVDGAPIWANVHVGETLLIALVGGVLGVLFTVPLRRAFVVEANLAFPEGVACAEVLETGERGGRGVGVLAGGIVVSAAYALLTNGIRLWADTVQGARRVGAAVFGGGLTLSPILVGVGYIVGLRVASLLMLGGVLAWGILIPLFLTVGIPGLVEATPYAELPPLTAALTVWTTKIRLVGGGAMVTGGLYTLWRTRDSLKRAFSARRGATAGGTVPRTERDLDMRLVALAIGAMIVPIFLLYWYFTQNIVHALAAAVLMGIAGFFFSAVAGYMAGVVGSSNNPISGVTILTLVTASLLLLALGATGAQGITAALAVGAVICCAGALAGDTLQDLKTGMLVGSTPWKQQTAQMLGVVAFAGVAPFVLQLLVGAYGFAGPANPGGLAAPQSFLMARILQGIFGGTLDWNLVLLGMGIGIVLVLFRLPVMAVAVGIYLPITATAPIFLGGLVAWWVNRRVAAKVAPLPEPERRETTGRVEQSGLLFASGLIAGEAIMGILLAALIPFEPTAAGGGDVERIVTFRLAPLLAGLLLAASILVFGARLGRARIAAAVGTALAAGAASLWLALTGYHYAQPIPLEWPATLLFAYVTFLVAYLPWREAGRAGPASPAGEEFGLNR